MGPEAAEPASTPTPAGRPCLFTLSLSRLVALTPFLRPRLLCCFLPLASSLPRSLWPEAIMHAVWEGKCVS